MLFIVCVTQQNKQEKCTVFWDYENCPCPMSTKIGTVVYDIKRKIDHFLGKKVNKVKIDNIDNIDTLFFKFLNIN